MKTSKFVIIISLAFAILAVSGISVISAGAKAADVDGDGTIGIGDTTKIQKVLAGIEEPTDNFFEIADADEDGRVSIDDATYIQKYIAGLLDEPSGKEPNSVKLSSESLTLKVGNTYTISVSTDLADYSGGFEWISSNPLVAAVSGESSDSAVISARMLGTTDITVRTANRKTATCKVTVSGSAVKCIDVSTWQGTEVDFNRVKASGIDYVILRAGYGRETYQKDDTFEINYKKAKAAGMKVGAYWFSYAMSPEEAVAEAKACLYCIDGKTFDLPVYYDMEYAPAISKLDKQAYTNLASGFCKTITDAGYKAGVYASAYVFGNELNYNKIAESYSVWNAEWNSDYTVNCDIWQYTSEARVDGIYGNVDCSYIFNLNILN